MKTKTKVIKAKLYSIERYEKEKIKDLRKELKINLIKYRSTGKRGFFLGIEVECWVMIQAKSLKTFIKRLDKKIHLFKKLGVSQYSLIRKKNVILTEKNDFEKMRELYCSVGEKFLGIYFYSSNCSSYLKDSEKELYNFIKSLEVLNRK